MNHEPDIPDPRDSDSGPVEERGRLAEIQRRLKAARPRPPSVDLVALLRMANGGEVESAAWGRSDGSDVSDLSDGSDVSEMSDGSDCIRVERPTRVHGFWTAVAGSWICGVAVGVLVTLMLVNRPAAVVAPVDSIARQEVQVPEPAEEPEVVAEKPVSEADEDTELDHAPVAPVLPPERRTRKDALLALIADPHGGWHSAAWMDGSVLRAGMLHRRTAGEPRDTAPGTPDTTEQHRDKAVSSQPKIKRTLDPQPPAAVSRGQLLERLLREATGHGVL
jgi:hypothetical protein